MFLISRDGSEDIYARSDRYAMENDDLVFYDAADKENGRVIGFGQSEGNTVVYVGDEIPEDPEDDDSED